MKRVLIVAPDQPGISAVPEIRLISSLPSIQVVLLNGPVTNRDLYDAVRQGAHIIHFAVHSEDERLLIGEHDSVDPKDLAQVARMAGAELVFFNSCRSGLLASYLVRHGVDYAIHANVDVRDTDAWKLAAAFYDSLDDQLAHKPQEVDYPAAYLSADSGDGLYGLAIAPKIVMTWQGVLDELKHNTEDIIRLQGRLDRYARTQQVLLVALIVEVLLTLGAFATLTRP